MTNMVVATSRVVLSIALAAVVFAGTSLSAQVPADDSRAWRPIEVIEKRALLIGNADYRGTTPLRNTVADVRALEEALTDLGFEVMSAENLTLEAMKATVREFAVELSPGDLGLFYYSGHGVQVDSENYLLPVDFESGTLRSEVADEAYSASRVMRMLKDQGARVRVMVLDACRNNPFVDERSTGRGLAAMHSGAEGSLVVFTTGEGDIASDNAGGDLGLYVTHLLPELRRETVELKDTFERTRAAVYHAAIQRGETQRPAHYEDLIGKVYVRGGPTGTPDSRLRQQSIEGSEIAETTEPANPKEPSPTAPQSQIRHEALSAETVREEISAAIRAATLEERGAIEKLERVIEEYGDIPSAQQMIALLREKLEASRVRLEAKWRWNDIRVTGSRSDISEFIEKYRNEPAASEWVSVAELRSQELQVPETAETRWQAIGQWPRFETLDLYIQLLDEHRTEIEEYLAEYENDTHAEQATSLARDRLVDIGLLENATVALDSGIGANTIEALEAYIENFGSLRGGQGLAAEARVRLEFLLLPMRAAQQWETIKETTDGEELQQYISDYGEDLRVVSFANLARDRLNLLPKLLIQKEARTMLSKALESGDAEVLLELIEKYANSPDTNQIMQEAIDRWNMTPEPVKEIARWERIKNAREPEVFQVYIDEYRDSPTASKLVKLAKGRFDHWQEYAPIQQAIDAIEFVRIPLGSFRMGSVNGDSDERPLTEVTISEEFMLARFETTQRLWVAVMESNPSEFVECGLDCPVENVSWNDVQQFLAKLNKMEGAEVYGMPTEAEWEYAARAGSTVDHQGRNLDAVAWHQENSGTRSRLVGTKDGDSFGLHDMLGNVWEWVQDWAGRYPGYDVADPTGATTGSHRVTRGGSWITEARQCRLTNRNPMPPDDRVGTLGFRIAKRPPSR